MTEFQDSRLACYHFFDYSTNAPKLQAIKSHPLLQRGAIRLEELSEAFRPFPIIEKSLGEAFALVLKRESNEIKHGIHHLSMFKTFATQ
jgi:hypothetical protein